MLAAHGSQWRNHPTRRSQAELLLSSSIYDQILTGQVIVVCKGFLGRTIAAGHDPEYCSRIDEKGK